MVVFTDAVVAIAITLVVLPLVDEAGEREGETGLEFLTRTGPDIIAAAISFAVIAVFWFNHHRLFERATHRAPRLMQLNMLWLAGIAALPVVTVVEVRARSGDRSAYALYVGTIVFLMLMARLQELVLVRSGALGDHGSDRGAAIDDTIPLVLIVAALVIGLVLPVLGTLPMLLLLISRPTRLLAGRVLGYTAKL